MDHNTMCVTQMPTHHTRLLKCMEIGQNVGVRHVHNAPSKPFNINLQFIIPAGVSACSYGVLFSFAAGGTYWPIAMTTLS